MLGDMYGVSRLALPGPMLALLAYIDSISSTFCRFLLDHIFNLRVS